VGDRTPLLEAQVPAERIPSRDLAANATTGAINDGIVLPGVPDGPDNERK
jgi:hypothetical protein